MASPLRPLPIRQAGILGPVESADPVKLRDVLLQTAGIIDHPVFEVTASWGTQATLTRTLTLQVRDRRGNALPGRFAVLWYISSTDGGAPGTSQTVGAASAGGHLQTITANSVFLSYTDATGKLVVPITLGGAGSRTVLPAVIGRLDSAVGRTAAWV